MYSRIPSRVVEVLERRGVRVVIETGAWERGSNFAQGIYGGMIHHWGSAAAATGAVHAGHCYSRSQGGLRTDERINCNWFSDRDGTLHLIAAGASNYSSCYGSQIVLEEVRTDTWPGGTARERGLKDSGCGNRYFWNMEAEHPGDGSPMPIIQETAIVELMAAMAEVLEQSIMQEIGHLEWTPRKIDPRWNGPGNRMPALRIAAQQVLETPDDVPPITPPPQETDMMQMPPTIHYGDGAWNTTPAGSGGRKEMAFYVGNAQSLLTIRGFIDEKSEDTGALPVDEKFGHGTESAVDGFQMSVGLDPDGVVGPMTWTALLLAG